MLTVVKKTPQELGDWLATEAGFIAGLCSYDSEPIVLEPYQVAFLANRSRFRWVTKSRQVGYSFVVALEALARCHLRDGYTAVFVSYNLDDAKEKILVARQVYEEMPLAYQKKLVVDSKTELAFEPIGKSGRLSRILSVPSKAPRGKKGDVVLDELAHYVNDRQVYTGSTALILRSSGQLTGCSTPLGRRGIFWEIALEELRKYPHHRRQEADLSRMMNTLAIARLSIDKSGIGMNLAENLGRAYPQVVGEAFTNASKERWCTDFKILLQRRDVDLPRDRELVAQLHSIKRRVMPSGNVSFDAERTNRGHADRFWALVLACQKERGPARGGEAEVGVRVIG